MYTILLNIELKAFKDLAIATIQICQLCSISSYSNEHKVFIKKDTNSHMEVSLAAAKCI